SCGMALQTSIWVRSPPSVIGAMGIVGCFGAETVLEIPQASGTIRAMKRKRDFRTRFAVIVIPLYYVYGVGVPSTPSARRKKTLVSFFCSSVAAMIIKPTDLPASCLVKLHKTPFSLMGIQAASACSHP